MSEWQPIETADLHKLFGFAERVLLATSDGRVTQAAAHFVSTHGFVWSCAYGNNVADPRHPSEYLKHRATHWMPLPEPPQLELHEELDDKNEALHVELAELYRQIHELRSNRAAQHSDLADELMRLLIDYRADPHGRQAFEIAQLFELNADTILTALRSLNGGDHV